MRAGRQPGARTERIFRSNAYGVRWTWCRALAGGLAGALLVSGCGASAAPPPPAAPPPSAAAPALAIPADLDVVVRIDLDPIRAALPDDAALRLVDALGTQLDTTAEVVRLALGRARQVWIAWRPGARPELWDNVIVLRGDFSGIREGELTRAFHPARLLAGGWRSYAARKPQGRAAPAAIYAHHDELWVVASVAEIDAVDRLLEGRADEPPVEVPERGVLSLGARLPGVAAQLRGRAPKAARFLERARTASASADLTSEGLKLIAEMRFERVEDAERASRALELLLAAMALEGPSWWKGVEVTTVASTLAVRARVPHEALSQGWLSR